MSLKEDEILIRKFLSEDIIAPVMPSTSLVQSERVQNKVQTEFVPGVYGHLAKFQETVQLKAVAC